MGAKNGLALGSSTNSTTSQKYQGAARNLNEQNHKHDKVEKIIENLKQELKEQAREFDKLSEVVCSQDITMHKTYELMENATEDLKKLKHWQQDLDKELDSMEEQQKQLEENLSKMKDFLDQDWKASSSDKLETPDLTRIAMSNLAKEVQRGMSDTRLQLHRLVTDMNKQYRASTAKNIGGQDAMRSLNDHHQLIRWLGQAVGELEQDPNPLAGATPFERCAHDMHFE